MINHYSLLLISQIIDNSIKLRFLLNLFYDYTIILKIQKK